MGRRPLNRRRPPVPGSTIPAVLPDIARCLRMDRRWARHGEYTWVSRPAESALPEAGELVRALRPHHGRSRAGRTPRQHAALAQDDGGDAAVAQLLRSGVPGRRAGLAGRPTMESLPHGSTGRSDPPTRGNVPSSYDSRGRRRRILPRTTRTTASRIARATQRTTPITRGYITSAPPAARPRQRAPASRTPRRPLSGHDRSAGPRSGAAGRRPPVRPR